MIKPADGKLSPKAGNIAGNLQKNQSAAMEPKNYLNNLTPLRGIAAMLTVIFHVAIYIGPLVNIFRWDVAPGPLIDGSMWLNRMYLMVDFFFILSGFIMSHVYGDLFINAATRPGFKKFAFARFARVYPLHFSMLIYTVVLFAVSAKLNVPPMPVMQVDNNTYSILTNLLLLHSMNFHDWFTWVHSSWSISTEWWVYMIFPFLVKPFFRLRTTGKIIVALSCLLGYIVIMFFIVPIVPTPKEFPFLKSHGYSGYSINISYQYGFLRCLFGFVLGMVTYQAYRANWNRSVLGNGYVMAAATLLLFISMHFALPDALSACFFPIIILSGAFGSSRIDKIFSAGPMQKLGDWSFSIYLIHQPLLFTIGNVAAYCHLKMDLSGGDHGFRMFAGWIICILFIAVLLPLSHLTYKYLEVPARNWLKLNYS